MRWAVGSFYAAMVAFAVRAGGVEAGGYVLFAAVALIVMLRPAEAGTAITGWASRFFRRRAVERSSPA